MSANWLRIRTVDFTIFVGPSCFMALSPVRELQCRCSKALAVQVATMSADKEVGMNPEKRLLADG